MFKKNVTKFLCHSRLIFNPIIGSRHSSYTSHQSRISYTSHGDLLGGMTKESRLRNRSSRNQSLLSTNPQNAAQTAQGQAQAYAGTNHHNKEIREYVSAHIVKIV
jgi:hypothetical protein